MKACISALSQRPLLASCLAAGLTSIRALLATDSYGLHEPPGPTANCPPPGSACAKLGKWLETAQNGNAQLHASRLDSVGLFPSRGAVVERLAPLLCFCPPRRLSPPLSERTTARVHATTYEAIRHQLAQKSRCCGEPLGATLNAQTPRKYTYVCKQLARLFQTRRTQVFV
ncbi:hypothetical protein Q8A67_001074 [Cirrhinus molitorella]|uniref:Secreted protein n=1 Tax=Cirrhinus molitorella TaxID=172907 RepID=A0AA88QL59_9TELE|nr:hypothetical protein Q8A67_001074 [Cirrhinus molitorella]